MNTHHREPTFTRNREEPRISVVQFFPTHDNNRSRALGALCDTAAMIGARIGLEFMPFSFLPELSDAWELVQATDRENCGVVLDSWHLQRTTGWESTLDAIPRNRLYSVQLCDAAEEPETDLREEARHRRLPPGPQSINVLRRLKRLDFPGQLSTEVWSDELFRADPQKAADRLFLATVTALRGANWPE